MENINATLTRLKMQLVLRCSQVLYIRQFPLLRATRCSTFLKLETTFRSCHSGTMKHIHSYIEVKYVRPLKTCVVSDFTRFPVNDIVTLQIHSLKLDQAGQPSLLLTKKIKKWDSIWFHNATSGDTNRWTSQVPCHLHSNILLYSKGTGILDKSLTGEELYFCSFQ